MAAEPAWFEEVARRAGVSVAASLWEGGVRLSLDDGVALDVHARIDGRSYADTPSFTLFLRHDGRLAPAAEARVRRLVDALAAADPGGLALPKGEQVPEEQVPEAARTGPPPSPPYVDAMSAWLQVAADLPARLRHAACLAWHAHLAGEPYPFAGALGVDPAADPLHAWVLSRWPAGFTRDDFAATGASPEALMAVLAPLRELGVCEVDDAGVRFFPGVGADVAIHAVLLWSPRVRAAARAAWDVCPDDARARLDAALAAAR